MEDTSKIKNNELLAGLSEEERALAFSVLQEMSSEGTSELYDKLKYADYDEIPVDINTFLHDKQYLGNGLIDGEGRFTLFPFWEEKLKEIFPTNTDTSCNTLILTGAIGIGKTLVSVVCLLYLLYRLLCLKDPYLFYGLQPIDKISISLMNITLENAKGVAMDKMNQLILSSSWFMSHGKMTGTQNLVFVPNKHIEVIAASSNNQVIGRAIFCLDGDTIVITDHGEEKMSDIVDCDRKFLMPNGQYSDVCRVKPTLITRDIYEIELEDGTLLKCTPNHRFLLKDGSYKEAQYLTEFDELQDYRGSVYEI